LKAPLFKYFAPPQLAEATALLPGRENVRLLAGGQSLMATLNVRWSDNRPRAASKRGQLCH